MSELSREQLVQEAMRICKRVELLAEELGVSERTVYRWVTGDKQPSGDNLMKLYNLVIRYAES